MRRRDSLCGIIPSLARALRRNTLLRIIQWEAGKKSIVPTQKVIPKRSRRSLEIPIKVGSVCRHLKNGKVIHEALFFGIGIGFGASIDGIDLVCDGPFANDDGKGLVDDLGLEWTACDFGMDGEGCITKTGIEAMVDVNVENDVIVTSYTHEALPFSVLEGMVHDDWVSGSGKILANRRVGIPIKILDHIDSSVQTPRERFVQDSKGPDSAIDGGIILECEDLLSHASSERDLFGNSLS